MGFFDKSLYLRTFFVILPIGIAITYASYQAISTPSGLEGLNYNSGLLSFFEVKNDYEPNSNKKQKLIVLNINNDKTNYFRAIDYVPDTLVEYLSKGDSIEIWSNSSGRFWQLKSNDQMLLKYKSGSVLWFYGLFLFGIGTIVIAVLHLIKGRGDLFGGKKKEEEDEGDGKPKKWTWF